MKHPAARPGSARPACPVTLRPPSILVRAAMLARLAAGSTGCRRGQSGGGRILPSGEPHRRPNSAALPQLRTDRARCSASAPQRTALRRALLRVPWSATSGSPRQPVSPGWRGGRWPNNGPTGLSAGAVASQVFGSEAVVGHPPPDPFGVGGSRWKVQGGAHRRGHGFGVAGEAAESPGHGLGAGRYAPRSQADAVKADELHEQPPGGRWWRPGLLEAREGLHEALEALGLVAPGFDVGPAPNRADHQGDDGLGEAPLSPPTVDDVPGPAAPRGDVRRTHQIGRIDGPPRLPDSPSRIDGRTATRGDRPRLDVHPRPHEPEGQPGHRPREGRVIAQPGVGHVAMPAEPVSDLRRAHQVTNLNRPAHRHQTLRRGSRRRHMSPPEVAQRQQKPGE